MPGGRPPERTDAKVDGTLAMLSKGFTVESAAADGGDIHDDTWRAWCAADPELFGRSELAKRKGKACLERELLDTTDSTRANVRLRRLGNWDRAAWGATQSIEHTGQLSIASLAASVKAPDAVDG